MKTLKHPALLLIALIWAFTSTPLLAATYRFSLDDWYSEGFPDGSYAFNNGRIYGEFEIDYKLMGPIEQPDTYLVQPTAIHFAGNPLFDVIENNLRGELIAIHGMGFYAQSNTIYYADLMNYWQSTGTPDNIGAKDTLNKLTVQLRSQEISGAKLFLEISDFSIDLTATSGGPIIVTKTPLPGALGLFGLGLVGLSYFRKKRTI